MLFVFLQGYRVLAVAWKPVGRITDDLDSSGKEKSKLNAWETSYQTLKRDEFESDLRMLGLVVLDNPIKPESEPSIRELQSANFRLLMATGKSMQ